MINSEDFTWPRHTTLVAILVTSFIGEKITLYSNEFPKIKQVIYDVISHNVKILIDGVIVKRNANNYSIVEFYTVEAATKAAESS